MATAGGLPGAALWGEWPGHSRGPGGSCPGLRSQLTASPGRLKRRCCERDAWSEGGGSPGPVGGAGSLPRPLGWEPHPPLPPGAEGPCCLSAGKEEQFPESWWDTGPGGVFGRFLLGSPPLVGSGWISEGRLGGGPGPQVLTVTGAPELGDSWALFPGRLARCRNHWGIGQGSRSELPAHSRKGYARRLPAFPPRSPGSGGPALPRRSDAGCPLHALSWPGIHPHTPVCTKQLYENSASSLE